LNCPNCGKEIKDEDAVYCPYCKKLLKYIPSKKTGLPIAGGILIILASCITFFISLLEIIASSGTLGIYSSLPLFETLFLGIFGIIIFALGLTGGIMALTRKNFTLSIVGICFSIVEGFMIIIAGGTAENNGLMGGLLLGLPIIVLSILGLIFVTISKAEFT